MVKLIIMVNQEIQIISGCRWSCLSTASYHYQYVSICITSCPYFHRFILARRLLNYLVLDIPCDGQQSLHFVTDKCQLSLSDYVFNSSFLMSDINVGNTVHYQCVIWKEWGTIRKWWWNTKHSTTHNRNPIFPSLSLAFREVELFLFCSI